MDKEISVEELRKIQLDILNHVNTFCKAHDIKYSLSSGTLLGAVRHRGYIPWDDDIDIMMVRSEYDRFRQLYVESEQKRYLLTDHRNREDYCLPFIKIYDNKTFVKEKFLPCDIGINIDIFPIDGIPNDRFASLLLNKWILFCYYLDVCFTAEPKKRIWYKNFFIKYVKIFFKKPATVIQFYYFGYRFFSKMKSISSANLWFWRYNQHRVSNKTFEEFSTLSFEGRQYPCIKDYNNYLSSLYGDYMTPPPEHERTHHTISPSWKI